MHSAQGLRLVHAQRARRCINAAFTTARVVVQTQRFISQHNTRLNLSASTTATVARHQSKRRQLHTSRTVSSLSRSTNAILDPDVHAPLASVSSSHAVYSHPAPVWAQQNATRPLLKWHPAFEQRNIILMGAPGCGKSSVAKHLAKLLSLPSIDIDDEWLEPRWQQSVAARLAVLGDAAFIEAEAAELQQLNVQRTVISLSGSNPLHAASMQHLAPNGLFVYLDVDPEVIVKRCARMHVDRIVGQASHRSLRDILDKRRSVYENSYDLRCTVTRSMTPLEIAQKIQRLLVSQQEFVSTRDVSASKHSADTAAIQSNDNAKSAPFEFIDVVKRGLASDRGLFVPQQYQPFSLDEMERLLHLSYPEVALRMMERFPLGSLHSSQLRSVLQQAYSTFNHKDVLPVTPLRDNKSAAAAASSTAQLHLMETYHGPTASFKDLSLQLLPRLLSASMQLSSQADQQNNSSASAPASANSHHSAMLSPHESINQQTEHTATAAHIEPTVGLLVATSGDTGTAAVDGFVRSSPESPVIVLYPIDGVSIVQKRQMQAEQSKSVLCLGIRGDFDFCQTLVKDIFNDVALNSRFAQLMPGLVLSSANSMNWGRFVPQLNFTLYSYLQLVKQGVLKLGAPLDLCIPSGNFGNMLGAVYAQRCGVPLRRLVTASNTNNILVDFVRTGTYDLRKRKFTQTWSPSIDILVSSNVERLLHVLSDGDSEMIRLLFTKLAKDGYFTVSDSLKTKMQSLLAADWCSEEQCLATVRDVHRSTGRFIDPHTAVAVHVARQYADASGAVPMLVCSTAHWAKFPNAMLTALEQPIKDAESISDMFATLMAVPHEKEFTRMHPQLDQLKNAQVVHKTVVDANKQAVIAEIEKFILQFAQLSKQQKQHKSSAKAQ